VANDRTDGIGKPGPEGAATGPAQDAVLTVLKAPGPTLGVALVLHGGRSNSYERVEARHLSPARMVPFARHLHRAGKNHGLAGRRRRSQGPPS
jgi:hypothetical protein